MTVHIHKRPPDNSGLMLSVRAAELYYILEYLGAAEVERGNEISPLVEGEVPAVELAAEFCALLAPSDKIAVLLVGVRAHRRGKLRVPKPL